MRKGVLPFLLGLLEKGKTGVEDGRIYGLAFLNWRGGGASQRNEKMDFGCKTYMPAPDLV